MMIVIETQLATITSVFLPILMDNLVEDKELEFVLPEHSVDHQVLVSTLFQLEALVPPMVKLDNVDLCPCASPI